MHPSSGSVAAGAGETAPGRQVAVAAALAAAFALACSSGIPGLGDTDPYRHLAYAAAVWRSGFTLRGWPMLPFTLLGDTGVDLWWGFHQLLIPFTALGTLWGARLAGACIAAAVAASTAWLLGRCGQPRAGWFALAPLAFSFFTAYRAQLARPAALTVPLALACLVAGAGELAPGFALAASFAMDCCTCRRRCPCSSRWSGSRAPGSEVERAPRAPFSGPSADSLEGSWRAPTGRSTCRWPS